MRFDGVRFAYRPDREILPRFDLDVPAGQTIALVGSTGAGKSTLAKLIARFYDPSDGRITLDGVDLRDLTNQDLHRAVVMVTQEAYLFSGLGRRQHRARPARRDARGDRGVGEGGRARTRSSGRCPTATTPT